MICRSYTLHVMHLVTECGARLLQHSTRMPPTCSQRIIELTGRLWTQLQGNTWLFVSLQPEHFTIFCSGQEPAHLIIKGLGEFIFSKPCSGYGNSVAFQNRIIKKGKQYGQVYHSSYKFRIRLFRDRS